MAHAVDEKCMEKVNELKKYLPKLQAFIDELMESKDKDQRLDKLNGLYELIIRPEQHRISMPLLLKAEAFLVNVFQPKTKDLLNPSTMIKQTPSEILANSRRKFLENTKIIALKPEEREDLKGKQSEVRKSVDEDGSIIRELIAKNPESFPNISQKNINEIKDIVLKNMAREESRKPAMNCVNGGVETSAEFKKTEQVDGRSGNFKRISRDENIKKLFGDEPEERTHPLRHSFPGFRDSRSTRVAHTEKTETSQTRGWDFTSRPKTVRNHALPKPCTAVAGENTSAAPIINVPKPRENLQKHLFGYKKHGSLLDLPMPPVLPEESACGVLKPKTHINHNNIEVVPMDLDHENNFHSDDYMPPPPAPSDLLMNHLQSEGMYPDFSHRSDFHPQIPNCPNQYWEQNRWSQPSNSIPPLMTPEPPRYTIPSLIPNQRRPLLSTPQIPPRPLLKEHRTNLIRPRMQHQPVSGRPQHGQLIGPENKLQDADQARRGRASNPGYDPRSHATALTYHEHKKRKEEAAKLVAQGSTAAPSLPAASKVNAHGMLSIPTGGGVSGFKIPKKAPIVAKSSESFAVSTDKSPNAFRRKSIELPNESVKPHVQEKPNSKEVAPPSNKVSAKQWGFKKLAEARERKKEKGNAFNSTDELFSVDNLEIRYPEPFRESRNSCEEQKTPKELPNQKSRRSSSDHKTKEPRKPFDFDLRHNLKLAEDSSKPKDDKSKKGDLQSYDRALVRKERKTSSEKGKNEYVLSNESKETKRKNRHLERKERKSSDTEKVLDKSPNDDVDSNDSQGLKKKTRPLERKERKSSDAEKFLDKSRNEDTISNESKDLKKKTRPLERKERKSSDTEKFLDQSPNEDKISKESKDLKKKTRHLERKERKSSDAEKVLDKTPNDDTISNESRDVKKKDDSLERKQKSSDTEKFPDNSPNEETISNESRDVKKKDDSLERKQKKSRDTVKFSDNCPNVDAISNESRDVKKKDQSLERKEKKSSHTVQISDKIPNEEKICNERQNVKKKDHSVERKEKKSSHTEKILDKIPEEIFNENLEVKKKDPSAKRKEKKASESHALDEIKPKHRTKSTETKEGTCRKETDKKSEINSELKNKKSISKILENGAVPISASANDVPVNTDAKTPVHAVANGEVTTSTKAPEIATPPVDAIPGNKSTEQPNLEVVQPEPSMIAETPLIQQEAPLPVVEVPKPADKREEASPAVNQPVSNSAETSANISKEELLRELRKLASTDFEALINELKPPGIVTSKAVEVVNTESIAQAEPLEVDNGTSMEAPVPAESSPKKPKRGRKKKVNKTLAVKKVPVEKKSLVVKEVQDESKPVRKRLTELDALNQDINENIAGVMNMRPQRSCRIAQLLDDRNVPDSMPDPKLLTAKIVLRDCKGSCPRKPTWEEIQKHCFPRDASEIDCLLCRRPFHKTEITQHYKREHPESEVLIARLSNDIAVEAVIETARYDLRGFRDSSCCRFCGEVFPPATSSEVLLMHSISHTGEYRWECGYPNCRLTAISEDEVVSHAAAEHADEEYQSPIELFDMPEEERARIMGNICAICNYLQIQESNLEVHQETTRHESWQEIELYSDVPTPLVVATQPLLHPAYDLVSEDDSPTQDSQALVLYTRRAVAKKSTSRPARKRPLPAGLDTKTPPKKSPRNERRPNKNNVPLVPVEDVGEKSDDDVIIIEDIAPAVHQEMYLAITGPSNPFDSGAHGGNAANSIALQHTKVVTRNTFTIMVHPENMQLVDGDVVEGAVPIKILNFMSTKDQELTEIGEKSDAILNRMLSEPKLRDFYKCMGANCTYTTDDFRSFAVHLQDHRTKVQARGPKSWEKCSYCKKTFKHLEHHLATEHKYCRYQCDKCFYRGAEPLYLKLHQDSKHPNEVPNFYECNEAKLPRTNNKVVELKKYICQCESKFIKEGDFIAHLNMCDYSQAFQCTECEKFSENAECLVEHYQEHGFYKVHCGHCPFGAEDYQTVDEHHAEEHASKRSSIISRSRYVEPPSIASAPKRAATVTISSSEIGQSAPTPKTSVRSDMTTLRRKMREETDFLLEDPDFLLENPKRKKLDPKISVKNMKLLALKERNEPMVASAAPQAPSSAPEQSETDSRLVRCKPLAETDWQLVNNLRIRSRVAEGIYGPDEIDRLPAGEIFANDVQCALCQYKNKVKRNVVRHLRCHSTQENVPPYATTNPVPCLEKQDLMFNKMSNLADSSQMDREVPTEPTEEDLKCLPPQVDEDANFKCDKCSHQTPNIDNLCEHIRLFHFTDNYCCPKCPETVPEHVRQLALESETILTHMKYHRRKLFKCPYCFNFHYAKKEVEQHVAKAHPNKKQFLHTIREKDWVRVYKCHECTYECYTAEEVLRHLKTNHKRDGRYKCKLCDYIVKATNEFKKHAHECHGGLKCDTVSLYSSMMAERPSVNHDASALLCIREEPMQPVPYEPVKSNEPRRLRNIPIEAPVRKRGRKVQKFRCNVNASCSFTTPTETAFRNHLLHEFQKITSICISCDQELPDEQQSEHIGHAIQPYDHSKVPDFIELNIQNQMKLIRKKRGKKSY